MPVDHARKNEIRKLRTEYAEHGVTLTHTEAAELVADSSRQVLCWTCGWTMTMMCPECPGCGCYNGRCSGWRHQEYMHEDERAELAACVECGGDLDSGYGCDCEPYDGLSSAAQDEDDEPDEDDFYDPDDYPEPDPTDYYDQDGPE
jgi:hypothetical protein